MKKLLLTAGVLSISALSFAEEKTYKLEVSLPVELYGGLSAGYFYTKNPDGDAFKISNAVIGLSGGSDEFSFDIAFGAFLAPSLWDGGAPNSMFSYTTGDITQNEAGILWGYVTFSPFEKISLDVGYLTTNIGAEVVNTYDNKNITLGTVWYAQPVIYPGARLTFNLTEDISLYAEYNHDALNPNRQEAFAVGSLGSIAGIDYAVSYYDYTAYKNLIDVVLGYSVGIVELGLNFDYQWLDDSAKQAGQDDSAYGVAFYVTPNFGDMILVPVRIEYFDEGTSGIYSGGNAQKGTTFTVTPTFKPTENSFIRAEIAYIKTDNKVFDNDTEDTKTTFALELGITF